MNIPMKSTTGRKARSAAPPQLKRNRAEGEYGHIRPSSRRGLLLGAPLLALLILACSLCAGMISWADGSGERFEDGSILYETTGTEEVSVVGYYSTTASVDIPSAVEHGGISYKVASVGASAFRGYDWLTSVTIPDSVTNIGRYAFRGCSALSSVAIPEKVAKIGEGAFYGCEGLTSVSIPGSVTDIGDRAFGSCKALTKITVEESNEKYCAEDGVLFDKEKTVLIQCPCGKSVEKGESYHIPGTVISIGDYSFEYCSLTSIAFPNSIRSIGKMAFLGWSSIGGVAFYDSLETIGDKAFYNSGVTFVYIPRSVTSIGDRAFGACAALWDIAVNPGSENYSSEDGVLFDKGKTALIQYPIGKTEKEDSYTIPDTVRSIGNGAFQYCSLTSIAAPESLTSIGEEAFAGCSSLASFDIPGSVTEIGDRAFFSSGLESVSIPGSVASIGDRAFGSCMALTEITVEESNGKYCAEGGVLFDKGKTALIQYPIEKGDASYTIPDTVRSIGNGAFQYCSLTSIAAPESLTSIGEEAFASCSILASFDIPGSVTEIGEQAFYFCSSLKSITTGSAASIGYRTFFNCSGLRSVTISGSATDIGKEAFANCGSLASIDLPDSLRTISEYAFFECDEIESIHFGSNIQWVSLLLLGFSSEEEPLLTWFYSEKKQALSLADLDEFRDRTFKGTIMEMYREEGYKLTLDPDNGEAPQTKVQKPSEKIAEPPEPAKTGHTFKYWADEDGKKFNFKTDVMPAREMTLTAQWEADVFTVTFVTGTGTEIAEKHVYGEAITLPGEGGKISKTGYSLSGWQISGESDAYKPGTEYIVMSEVTFTAVWTVNQYTISFDPDGGSAVDPITQDYGSKVEKPEDPTKEGCTFMYWAKDGKEYAFGTMPAEDITLTAVWKANQYTITFDSNGGTAVNPITQDYGTLVKKPADPTKEGYRFVCWEKDGEEYAFGTMPAEDITLTAVWETLPSPVPSWDDDDDDPYVPVPDSDTGGKSSDAGSGASVAAVAIAAGCAAALLIMLAMLGNGRSRS